MNLESTGEIGAPHRVISIKRFLDALGRIKREQTSNDILEIIGNYNTNILAL